jgi:heme exporter protein CcmD
MIPGFFSAGQYAVFVWPAYAVSVCGLAAAVLTVWRLYRRASSRLAVLEKTPARAAETQA